MDSKVFVELPTTTYEALQARALHNNTDIVTLITWLLEQRYEHEVHSSEHEVHSSEHEVDSSNPDPMLELIGAYRSQEPLIDGIPASEHPELYTVANALGAQAKGKHAWEIAPQWYKEGVDGQAVRYYSGKINSR